MKTISFDGYWLCDGPPSGKNVVSSLIIKWAELFSMDKILVFVPAGRKYDDTQLQNLPNVIIIERPHRTFLHAFWVMFEMIPRKLTADAIITQNFTPLRRKSKKILQMTFVHDVIYKRHREWFTILEIIYLKLIDLGLYKADIILTSSESEGTNIRECFPSLTRQVYVVGLDVPVLLSAAKSSDLEVESFVKKPFILSVGRINARKNIANLVLAFNQSTLVSEYELYVVGEIDGKSELISQIGQQVKFLGKVNPSYLAWLYGHAEFFIFPSLDEGFGLPLIEANYFGCRTIASNIPVFNELGTAEAFFDPKSPDDLILKMEEASARLPLDNLKSSNYDGSWVRPITSIRSLL